MADARPGGQATAEHSELDLERGARGRLTVKDRAISKIAVAAALSVPGVVRQSGGLLKLPGRDLPRAEVTLGPDSVAIALYLAVAWPSPVAVLSQEVHLAVAERVETMTGLPVEMLHIVVAAAVPRTDDADARRLTAGCPESVAPIAARPPLARPGAALVALILAMGLLAVAVLAGREYLIAKEVIAPAAWLRNSVRWVADLHWQTWMGAVAIVAAVIGAVLVYISLSPRTRTHVPVGAADAPIVWLRPTDVARMCSAHAGGVGGVGTVHTTVDRRRATVHVTPNGEVAADDLEAYVRDAVAPGLGTLASPRELRIRIGRVKS
ncbi:Asp23/Gls24 family envelope stress response protein [Rhodococcus sp. NPDC003318]|uniref:Asp23/Gls24 family envelope stress response protein n=1 Tax=Rhodococcus sp. NPDC003318 TaxID=3364503 RepID=UPI0036AA21BF